MRNSYDDDKEYEDELDRMRARRARKQQQQQAKPAGARRREPDDAWEEIDIYQDDDYEDDDFDEDDFADEDDFYDDDYEDDDDYEEVRRPAKKQRKPVPSQLRQSEKRRSSGKESGSKGGSGRKTAAKKKKRKLFPLILLLFCIVVAGAAFSFWRNSTTGYWTIAVFGVDSREGGVGKGALSDVEMVCTINRQTGEIRLASVYRDTYVKIDKDGTYHKINEAYFKGGPEQGIYALEENFDLKIDDYATFNWKAVADTINILGGIDLEITDSEFAYINSFITETVQSTGIGSVHLQHSGMNHLDGVQAVAYARLRLMDTDFKRTERQRKVIGLAMQKAKQADIGVLNNIVETVLPQLSTSLRAQDVLALAVNINKYDIGATTGFPFSREPVKISGRSCEVPATLESNVIQLHQFLYGIEDYRPSQTVMSIHNKIVQDTGVGTVGQNMETNNSAGTGTSGGSTQPAAKPQETQQPAPPPVETAPPETPPESVTEESTETESETEETIEIPETIPVPETPETNGPGGPGEIGPGIPTSGAEIPTPEQPESEEKPTIGEVGPGVS